METGETYQCKDHKNDRDIGDIGLGNIGIIYQAGNAQNM